MEPTQLTPFMRFVYYVAWFNLVAALGFLLFIVFVFVAHQVYGL